MKFEDMRDFLQEIQNNDPQTKIMNAVLTCFQETKQLETLVIELQNKVNEIIIEWNKIQKEDNEDKHESAEALNNDMPEDTPQEGMINEDTGAAALTTSEEVE